MLLPSALPCEARPHLLRRPQYSSRLLPTISTEKASSSPSRAGNGLLGTCRALQALLTGSPSPASSPKITNRSSQLQSPAAIAINKKPVTRPAKVVKAPPKPPRGIKKRRRDIDDDGPQNQENENGPSDCKFSTPKRQRRIPTMMPLGLLQSDFDALQTPCSASRPFQAPSLLDSFPLPPSNPSAPVPPRPNYSDGEWTPEDDTLLVDVVLEKLKLSKKDWNECARKIGKDDDSVGKRWKALIGEGEVGLRRGSGWSTRPGLEGLWR
jgi:hypothetical protein